MNLPKLTFFKGLSDTGAFIKIAARIGLNMTGHEEANEEFDKFTRSRERLKKQISKSKDKRAIVQVIQSEWPGFMELAVERAKQLELDALDFLDILNVRSLSAEDQQVFVDMWSEQSNVVEFLEWLYGLVNLDIVSVGRSFQSLPVKEILENLITLAPTFQLAFTRLSRMFSDEST